MTHLTTTLFVLLSINWLKCVLTQSSAAPATTASCTDAENNCEFLVTSIDICKTRPASGALLCAKTCKMCNVDPSSITNPTNPIPTHTFPATTTSKGMTGQSNAAVGSTSQSNTVSGSTSQSNTVQFSTVSPTSGSVTVNCIKHKDATMVIPDTDHNTCYYYYDLNRRYKDAKQKCEAEGTHVVHLETNEEELRLGSLMTGFSAQFWLGMEAINGNWHWVGNGQQQPIADDLWEGQHDPNGHDKYAYNTPPNHWKAANENLEYRIICEENFK